MTETNKQGYTPSLFMSDSAVVTALLPFDKTQKSH